MQYTYRHTPSNCSNACTLSQKQHLSLQGLAIEPRYAHTSNHIHIKHVVQIKVTHFHTHTLPPTHTQLALTPVQEHMSPPTPLRISVINQTLRCRLCSTNVHTHTLVHTAQEAEHSREIVVR